MLKCSSACWVFCSFSGWYTSLFRNVIVSVLFVQDPAHYWCTVIWLQQERNLNPRLWATGAGQWVSLSCSLHLGVALFCYLFNSTAILKIECTTACSGGWNPGGGSQRTSDVILISDRHLSIVYLRVLSSELKTCTLEFIRLLNTRVPWVMPMSHNGSPN